jgi:probable HAF family extracellular repeat protein
VAGQNITLPADSLGNLGGAGPFCAARGINTDGDVVGTSSTGSQAHAFIHTGGAMYDLNNLIAGTPAVLTQATGVNDRGQISAQGWTNGISAVPCTASGSIRSTWRSTTSSISCQTRIWRSPPARSTV